MIQRQERRMNLRGKRLCLSPGMILNGMATEGLEGKLKLFFPSIFCIIFLSSSSVLFSFPFVHSCHSSSSIATAKARACSSYLALYIWTENVLCIKSVFPPHVLPLIAATDRYWVGVTVFTHMYFHVTTIRLIVEGHGGRSGSE
ncbi:hypothetical protein EV361DRAFT_935322 [Lentinula raphanica]|nr:hypothetical protein EV361DRAFT_935322 [Lentinula raphanica]